MTSLGRQTAKHWNHDLQCGLLEVNTDEEAKLVTLILPPLNGASGEGAIRFARRTMPDVRTVITVADGCRPVLYQCDKDGLWDYGYLPLQ